MHLTNEAFVSFHSFSMFINLFHLRSNEILKYTWTRDAWSDANFVVFHCVFEAWIFAIANEFICKFSVLICELLCYNTKSISCPLISFIWKGNQHNPSWKMFNTYQHILVTIIPNGSTKFEFHGYPSLIIGKGCKCKLGAWNDACTK